MAGMRIVLWVKGRRGEACLRKLLALRHDVSLIVADEADGASESAATSGILRLVAGDPNAPALRQRLRALGPDLFVLAGYGRILGRETIEIPRLMCLNLHAGKLPEYRGSSPLNWALINGETSFSLSIIRVDRGVDTGDVLLERAFAIGADDTIADLHHVANEQFPEMTAAVIDGLEAGTLRPRPQDEAASAYYPRRFPTDGLVLWDQLTAAQVHNRVRALTEPYPCAYTFWEGHRIRLLATRQARRPFFGEPGRVYRVTDGKLLVGAQDRCLWIVSAVLAATGEPIRDHIPRYAELATVRRWVEKHHETQGEGCEIETLTLTGAS
ncbi:MAG: methionyl-tRNA formyltransferase [Planctomycetota bacterium]